LILKLDPFEAIFNCGKSRKEHKPLLVLSNLSPFSGWILFH